MPASSLPAGLLRAGSLGSVGVLVAALLGGCAVFGGGATAPSTVVITVPGPPEGSAPTPGGTSAPAPGVTLPPVTIPGSPTAPVTPAAPPPAPPAGPVIEVPGSGYTVFSTPSGNIICGGGLGDAGWDLRCDVNQHSWRLPPKPADCEFDWGHGTYLAKGRAGLTCVSDTVAGSDLVGMEGTWWNGKPGSQVVSTERGKVVALAYGASMRFGPITCLSQSDGLHCTDTTTGAGFDISREAYRLR